MSIPVLGLVALVTAAVGALGGLGGAIILVPALVVFGVPASEAAPLGLISVAGGSLAAGSQQLLERTVNHRIGVTTEIAASAGAVAGALLSGMVSDMVLTRILAATALAAAVVGGFRKGVRNPPQPSFGAGDVGEWPGTLAGAYQMADGVAPYRVQRLAAGLIAMTVSGLVAGLAGTSGGFVKTPAASELMHLPVKVAASTTTFTIGVTSAAALLVFAAQGRIDPATAAPALAGALAGGFAGAALQARVSPPVVRRALSALLVIVAVVLFVS